MTALFVAMTFYVLVFLFVAVVAEVVLDFARQSRSTERNRKTAKGSLIDEAKLGTLVDEIKADMQVLLPGRG